LAFFEFSSCRLRPALAGSGVPGKNSLLAVRLFSSLPTKEKNTERFRKNEKSLPDVRTAHYADVTDGFLAGV
jgi:hypothetical protein